jgi:protein O-mannosyl-transferase
VKKRPFLICTVLVFLAVIAVYSNHFYNGFHFDDDHSVVDNPYIRSLKNIPLFFKDGSTSSVLPQNQAYRPVVTTSLALDYSWDGYDLFSFHLSTFILFMLQGLLMLLLFKKLLSISSSSKYIGYVALFATAWYMLHPAIAETINYIIARSDVISTVAVVAGFVLYTSSPFCRNTFLYLLPVGIGALAKPPAVMFAPLLFFYILLFEEKLGLLDIFKKSNLKPLWSSIRKSLPSFIFCVLLYLLIDKLTPKTWMPGGSSAIKYLITQPFVILHYFYTFFWPTGLSADSDWGLLPDIADIRFIVGCSFILIMFAIAVYTSGKAVLRPVSFGIIWFFLALLPSSSIIPLGEVLNDHRMYFPFVGLVISVSWALGLLLFKFTSSAGTMSFRHKTLILVPVLVLFCTCAYGTWKRNQVWHSEESLWFNVTVKSPKNGRGMMNYGLTKMDRGQYDLAGTYFAKAMKLAPEYSFIYVNMAVLKEKMGAYDEAEKYYLKSLSFGDNYASHFYLYGRFLYRRARFIEAEVLLQKAIALSVSDIRPRELLLNTYAILGQWDFLKDLSVKTLKIAPENLTAMMALEESNEKKTGAEMAADKAMKFPTAENYLALSLSYFYEGKYQQCIEAANRALKIKANYPEAYNTIGCAYNLLNQFDKANEAFKAAVSQKPGFQLAQNNLNISRAHQYITDEGISSQTYTAENYINQSLLYYNERQYELCIAACVSALMIHPDYDLAYNNLCAAYVKLQQWDDAITVGEKGLQINPNNERLKNNLAEARESRKMFKR